MLFKKNIDEAWWDSQIAEARDQLHLYVPGSNEWLECFEAIDKLEDGKKKFIEHKDFTDSIFKALDILVRIGGIGASVFLGLLAYTEDGKFQMCNGRIWNQANDVKKQK